MQSRKVRVFRPGGIKITLDLLGYFVYQAHTWDINTYGYLYRKSGENKTKLLHRQLMNAEDKTLVDHINRDTLDNRLCNLRFATKAQNAINRLVEGVRQRSANCWQARLRVDGKEVHLGSFRTYYAARKAYISAHIEQFKEFSPYYEKTHSVPSPSRVNA